MNLFGWYVDALRWGGIDPFISAVVFAPGALILWFTLTWLLERLWHGR